MAKLISLLVLALVSLVVVAYEEEEPSYEDYKEQYSLKFTEEEDCYRKLVFAANLAHIRGHNLDCTKTYFEGVNRFTFLTRKEFSMMFLQIQPL